MDGTSSDGLRLPVQAAVNRTASYGALADGAGMDASQINWQQLANTGMSILGGLLGGL